MRGLRRTLGSAPSDDELTVYADNQSTALLTHDVEFSRRRERNVIGKHVWLRCSEMEAAQFVAELTRTSFLIFAWNHSWANRGHPSPV